MPEFGEFLSEASDWSVTDFQQWLQIGADMVTDADLTHQRQVVDAFLAASRSGDFDALLAVLDPEVVLRMDHLTTPAGQPRELHGEALLEPFANLATLSDVFIVAGAKNNGRVAQ